MAVNIFLRRESMATILKYKVADGYRWRVRWWDENEKQVSKTFDRQTIARDFMVKLEHEMREGIYTEPTKIRVSDYLYKWIDSYQSNLAPNTARSYKVNIDHICKHIGNKQMQKLTAIDIESTYAKLSESLSGTSLLYIHRTLSRAFNQAEKQRLIKRNVLDLVETPKKNKEKKSNFVHPDDIPRYLKAFENHYLYPAVCLAVFAGLRRGEVLGLKWSDIKNGNLIIQHNMTYDGIRPPKSGSKRLVPISAPIERVLHEQKKRQNEEKEKLWEKYYRSEFVVTKKDGTLINPRLLSNTFKRVLKRKGLEVIRFHDLRHTAASLMILEGVDLKTVSEILGHSSISITADIYGHVLEEQKRKAVGQLDKYFI